MSKTANSRLGLYALFALSSTSTINKARGSPLFAKKPTAMQPDSSVSVPRCFQETRLHTCHTVSQKLGGCKGDSGVAGTWHLAGGRGARSVMCGAGAGGRARWRGRVGAANEATRGRRRTRAREEEEDEDCPRHETKRRAPGTQPVAMAVASQSTAFGGSELAGTCVACLSLCRGSASTASQVGGIRNGRAV